MTSKKINENLNIFVSCGKDYYIPENKYLIPIQVGAKNAKKIFCELNDNTGDNISELNPYLCELTAQYWAWKNVDCEYYGFCHYRRYFSFSDKKWSKDSFNFCNIEKLKKENINALGYDEKLFDKIKDYDLIVPVAADVVSAGHKSVYGHYSDSILNIKDLDLLLEVINDLSPEYNEAAKEYLFGGKGLFCNMFIMKKDLFMEYSEWEFKILFEYLKRWDHTNYFIESLRTPGHMGERLLGIYYTYLMKHNPKIKVGHNYICKFDKCYFESSLNDVKPAFEKNNVPIVMATNEHYSKFAAATLISLAEHSDKNKNYDIIVLSNSTTDLSKQRLLATVSEYKNLSLRFLDPTSFIDGFNLNERSNITVETFYRLLIPDLIHYDKMLYLDSDMIILEDVSKLLDLDIEDNYFGGVIDISHAATINHKYFDSREYYSQFGVKNLYTFINAGVLVVNSKKLREDFTSEYLLFFAQQYGFKFQDQDLINVLFEGKIKFLDYKWNFYADGVNSPRGIVNKIAPAEMYQGWLEASKNPCIIHYAGNEKPWYFPDYEYAEIFWKYFEKTPFYHAFVMQNSRGSCQPAPVIYQGPQRERFIRKLSKLFFPLGSKRRLKLKNFCNKVSYIIYPKDSERRKRAKARFVKRGLIKREL